MDPREILATIEGFQPTEMRSRAAVANALRMAQAGQGPASRVWERSAPPIDPSSPGREGTNIPGMAGTGMAPSGAKMRSLPGRFWDEDYISIDNEQPNRDQRQPIPPYMHPDFPSQEEMRAPAPGGYNEPTIVQGGEGQDQMAGGPEYDAIMQAIQAVPGGDEAGEPVDTPPSEEAGEYGPSLDYKGTSVPAGMARDIRDKYISQGIDIQTMHPLELKIANELLTTDQTRRNALFANEVIFANAILDDVDREGANWFAESFTGNSPYVVKLPGNLGNLMVSSKRQAYDMAKRLFIEGVLRPKTGAVINYSAEEPTYKDTFFPTPFDDEETIKLKRAARAVEQEGVVNQAGPLYKAPDLSQFLPPEYLGSQPVGEGASEDGWMTLPSGKRYRIVK